MILGRAGRWELLKQGCGDAPGESTVPGIAKVRLWACFWGERFPVHESSPKFCRSLFFFWLTNLKNQPRLLSPVLPKLLAE